jgi:hypothetical protein
MVQKHLPTLIPRVYKKVSVNSRKLSRDTEEAHEDSKEP